MKLQLQALSCSGGQGLLVGSTVVTELDYLMSARKFDQGGEGSYKLEATLLHVSPIYLLVKLAIEDSILGRLDGSEAEGGKDCDNQHRDSHRHAAALGLSVHVTKTVVHIRINDILYYYN
jgi:hypothetical protein